jgi:hypothetical protein
MILQIRVLSRAFARFYASDRFPWWLVGLEHRRHLSSKFEDARMRYFWRRRSVLTSNHHRIVSRNWPVVVASVGANARLVGDKVGWVCPRISAVGLAQTMWHAFGGHGAARVRGMAARLLHKCSYRPDRVI